MNENLNLVEILKDCPKGTKLYSVLHGEVEFEKIIVDEDYPIKYKFQDARCNYIYAASVSIEGKYSISQKGECTLFPSKDQRDWSKFNIEPKFNISTLQPFDKVLVRDGLLDRWECAFFSYIDDDDDDEMFVCNGFHIAECVPYNEETKHLVGTCKTPPKKYITWEE